MPNYTKELLACFLVEKTNTNRRQTPKKTKIKCYTLTLPDGTHHKSTFLQTHAINAETGRAYLDFCTTDFDCEHPQPKLTLANDSNSDQELGRFHTIKNFVHVVDDAATWKKLRADLSKKTNMIKFKSAVKSALENRFDVGQNFMDEWDFGQYQTQLLAYERAFGKGSKRPTLAIHNAILLRHDEMLRIILSAGYVDQQSMTTYLLQAEERANKADSESEKIHERLDEFGNLLGALNTKVDRVVSDVDELKQQFKGLLDQQRNATAVQSIQKGEEAGNEVDADDDDDDDVQCRPGDLINWEPTAEQLEAFQAAAATGEEETVKNYIKGRDFRRLSVDTEDPSLRDTEACWLNDELVNAFMSLLASREERMRQEGVKGLPRSHFFNSFFFSVLFDERTRKSDHARVARWTKKIDIFEDYDLIIIPINKGSVHWALVVIDMRTKTVSSYDSFMAPCARPYLKEILKYLNAEHKAKKNGTPLPKGWKYVDTSNQADGIPRQENMFDCGVFICLYAYFLTLGYPLSSFDQQRIYDAAVRTKIGISILKEYVA